MGREKKNIYAVITDALDGVPKEETLLSLWPSIGTVPGTTLETVTQACSQVSFKYPGSLRGEAKRRGFLGR